uniref:Uncharacterized protein n=1 Tax=Arundo donax TaxID=35708 RepID=A0A0A9CPK5_ARUDO
MSGRWRRSGISIKGEVSGADPYSPSTPARSRPRLRGEKSLLFGGISFRGWKRPPDREASARPPPATRFPAAAASAALRRSGTGHRSTRTSPGWQAHRRAVAGRGRDGVYRLPRRVHALARVRPEPAGSHASRPPLPPARLGRALRGHRRPPGRRRGDHLLPRRHRQGPAGAPVGAPGPADRRVHGRPHPAARHRHRRRPRPPPFHTSHGPAAPPGWLLPPCSASRRRSRWTPSSGLTPQSVSPAPAPSPSLSGFPTCLW